MKQVVDYEKMEASNRKLERIMEDFMSFKNELFQNLSQKKNNELNYLLNSTLDFMDETHDLLRRKPQQQKQRERRKQNVGK